MQGHRLWPTAAKQPFSKPLITTTARSHTAISQSADFIHKRYTDATDTHTLESMLLEGRGALPFSRSCHSQRSVKMHSVPALSPYVCCCAWPKRIPGGPQICLFHRADLARRKCDDIIELAQLVELVRSCNSESLTSHSSSSLACACFSSSAKLALIGSTCSATAGPYG